jgi:hypothetical protein
MLCHLEKMLHTQSMMPGKSCEISIAMREFLGLGRLTAPYAGGGNSISSIDEAINTRAIETSHWSGQYVLDNGALVLPSRAMAALHDELQPASLALFQNDFRPPVSRKVRLVAGRFLTLGSGVTASYWQHRRSLRRQLSTRSLRPSPVHHA